MIKRFATAMALLSAPVAAQQESSVRPGDQVRIHPGPRGVHEVVQARAGSLLVRRHGWDPVEVRVDSARIFRATGHEPRLRSAVRGGVYGALIGSAAGAVGAAATWTEPDFLANSRGEAAIWGGAGFGMLGGLAGVVAGGLMPRTRWTPVTGRPATAAAVVAPTVRDGAVGALVMLRF